MRIYPKVPRAFALPGDFTQPQITSNQNNYNPEGLYTTAALRVQSDASRNITGLMGGVDGRVIFIRNIGSFDIVLKNQDANSTAEHRFNFGADHTLAPGQTVILNYDLPGLRWRIIGGSRSGQFFQIEHERVGAIATGFAGHQYVHSPFEILGYILSDNPSGSGVIDIYANTYADENLPDSGDTITASAKPTLSSEETESDFTLTGWTKQFTSPQTMLVYNVDSGSTLTYYHLTLVCRWL